MTNMWRPHTVSGLHSVQYNISYSWGQQFSFHNDFIQAMMRAQAYHILSFWISRLSFPNWTNSCWHVANGWGFDRLVMAVIPHSRCQTGDGEQQCAFANRFSAIRGEQEKTFAEMESIVYASGKKKQINDLLKHCNRRWRTVPNGQTANKCTVHCTIWYSTLLCTHFNNSCVSYWLSASKL